MGRQLCDCKDKCEEKDWNRNASPEDQKRVARGELEVIAIVCKEDYECFLNKNLKLKSSSTSLR